MTKFGARFYCCNCGTRIAGPLRRLDQLSRLCLEAPIEAVTLARLLPQGSFVLSDTLIAAGVREPSVGDWTPGTVLFHNRDVRRHPTLFTHSGFGCCGYDGSGDPNLYCPGRHIIGTEVSESYMVQYARIPLTHLTRKKPVAAGRRRN